jgi:hypothetical protein
MPQGALDAVGDEGVTSAAPPDDRLSGPMRDNETRGVERWLIAPRADAQIDHPAPHDQRPDITEVEGLKAL